MVIPDMVNHLPIARPWYGCGALLYHHSKVGLGIAEMKVVGATGNSLSTFMGCSAKPPSSWVCRSLKLGYLAVVSYG